MQTAAPPLAPVERRYTAHSPHLVRRLEFLHIPGEKATKDILTGLWLRRTVAKPFPACHSGSAVPGSAVPRCSAYRSRATLLPTPAMILLRGVIAWRKDDRLEMASPLSYAAIQTCEGVLIMRRPAQYVQTPGTGFQPVISLPLGETREREQAAEIFSSAACYAQAIPGETDAKYTRFGEQPKILPPALLIGTRAVIAAH